MVVLVLIFWEIAKLISTMAILANYSAKVSKGSFLSMSSPVFVIVFVDDSHSDWVRWCLKGVYFSFPWWQGILNVLKHLLTICISFFFNHLFTNLPICYLAVSFPWYLILAVHCKICILGSVWNVAGKDFLPCSGPSVTSVYCFLCCTEIYRFKINLHTKIEIIPCLLPDHIVIKLEIKNKRNYRNHKNIWRINNTLWVIRKIREEIKKLLGTNEQKMHPIRTSRMQPKQA